MLCTKRDNYWFILGLLRSVLGCSIKSGEKKEDAASWKLWCFFKYGFPPTILFTTFKTNQAPAQWTYEIWNEQEGTPRTSTALRLGKTVSITVFCWVNNFLWYVVPKLVYFQAWHRQWFFHGWRVVWQWGQLWWGKVPEICLCTFVRTWHKSGSTWIHVI